MIMFVSDLRQVSRFVRVRNFAWQQVSNDQSYYILTRLWAVIIPLRNVFHSIIKYSKEHKTRDVLQPVDTCLRVCLMVHNTTFNYYIRCTTLCDNVCQWLATGQAFCPGPPLSSTNKTDRHDITEILLRTIIELSEPMETKCFDLQK
jgi:hypothetical protein